jgi:hypothetical protein
MGFKTAGIAAVPATVIATKHRSMKSIVHAHHFGDCNPGERSQSNI